MNTLISVKDLSFKYPGGTENILNRVNVEINKKDFTAVIGSNGSGKTTLCKAFNGLIPHFYVGDIKGEVIVDGLNTREHSVSELSKKTAYVYQDFENQLVRPTVFDEVTFAPLSFGMKDFKERGQLALEMLDLTSIKDEFIWQLSGGQKHLVALASVLSLDPEAIIIDEPVAQLDPVNAKKIYEKLKLLNEAYGKTIIVIEHHTEFIGEYCKKVIMMDKGQVVWQKPTKDALNNVGELIEKDIFPPQVTQAIHRLYQNNILLPITLSEGIDFLKNHPVSIAQQPYPEKVKKLPTPIVSLEGVTHGYKTLNRGMNYVFTDLDLSLYEGDRVAIVGSNGAGKSTLLKMITGIIKPKHGNVFVCGENAGNTPPEKLSEKVTYIYQNPEEMFIEDSIRKDIEYFLKVRDVPDTEQFFSKLVERFHLKEIENKDGRLLSGGQQRRSSMAIGLGMRPQVILLDEPTASLDISSRKEMLLMLEQLKDSVKTVVVATHDMQLVAEWANRVIVMDQGEIVKDGSSHDIFSDVALLEKASIQAPQIIKLGQALNLNPVPLSVDAFVSCLVAESGEEKLEIY
ncbi:ABC transporter ATP-binding protein [Aquibacillus albus]|uniref:Energy-coupling factor transport system ATP-binding protein n=1 Tax=Aquibacillus albus TaxID=1168171 RepID=A0ABS2MVY8_9BACI|nr:energy-coupling factor transporter ATPase [Aquibacillus albus]MBM7570010.1 energy-coupling factor transport system ATP-binding protein [Aquibacillus albus]